MGGCFPPNAEATTRSITAPICSACSWMQKSRIFRRSCRWSSDAVVSGGLLLGTRTGSLVDDADTAALVLAAGVNLANA
jgi:hypothetical protein